MELLTSTKDTASPHNGLHVIVTTGASDSHTWNLTYLELLIEEWGHRVTNLGPCVPDELLVSECLRLRPGLVVFSSVNGHGAQDGERAIAALRAHAELARTPAVIGGKLGIGGPEGAPHEAALLEAGFDAVFEDGQGIAPFRSYLSRLSRVPAQVGA